MKDAYSVVALNETASKCRYLLIGTVMDETKPAVWRTEKCLNDTESLLWTLSAFQETTVCKAKTGLAFSITHHASANRKMLIGGCNPVVVMAKTKTESENRKKKQLLTTIFGLSRLSGFQCEEKKLKKAFAEISKTKNWQLEGCNKYLLLQENLFNEENQQSKLSWHSRPIRILVKNSISGCLLQMLLQVANCWLTPFWM